MVRFVILEYFIDPDAPSLNCRKNQSDHVQQHWTHDLMRMRQFGLLPFEQLKVLVPEEEYASSVAEWSKPSKSKKWYHLTSDSFINLLHKVRFPSRSILYSF